MKKILTAALSSVFMMSVAPADAGPNASWAKKLVDRELAVTQTRVFRDVRGSAARKIIKRELDRTESRLKSRLGKRFDSLESEQTVVAALHTVLPVNSELTLARVGDLDVVALCMMDGAGDMWSGAFVVSSGEDFDVPMSGGGQVATDALGFFIRWTAAEDHPTRPGADVARPGEFPDTDLIGRTATTVDGETFLFEPWTIIYDGSCEVTAPITFGINGSDVEMFPEGDEPDPLPTNNDDGFEHVSADEVGTWTVRRFPWIEE